MNSKYEIDSIINSNTSLCYDIKLIIIQYIDFRSFELIYIKRIHKILGTNRFRIVHEYGYVLVSKKYNDIFYWKKLPIVEKFT